MPPDPFCPMELARVRWDELLRLAVFGGRSRMLRAVAALDDGDLRSAVLLAKLGALGDAAPADAASGSGAPAAPAPGWQRLDSACEESGVEGLLGAVAALSHDEAARLVVAVVERAVARAEGRVGQTSQPEDGGDG
jgi:hypothetical protein